MLFNNRFIPHFNFHLAFDIILRYIQIFDNPK